VEIQASRRRLALALGFTVQHMESQIQTVLSNISIPPKIEEWVRKQARSDLDTRQAEVEAQKQSALKAIQETEREAANLTSLRLRDLIDDDEFIRERQRLSNRELKMWQSLENMKVDDQTFEPAEVVISFSNRALKWFQSGDCEAKQLIVDSVCSNPTLTNKTLSIEAKKPFRNLPRSQKLPEMRAFREGIRTLYANRDPELLGILHNIRILSAKFEIQSDDEGPLIL
jgi:hypothetical protein